MNGRIKGTVLIDCVKALRNCRDEASPFLSAEKARALRIFKEVHAHEIHYWGAWAFEDLPSS